MKILLIEDSEHLRRSLVVGLSNLGFTIDETGDGSKGLSMAITNEYDFIILDLMLPNVDGITLLKSIRKMGNDVKVIILSAKSQPEDRVEGLMSGADDYLVKPFSFDELHARILTVARRGVVKNSDDDVRLGDFKLDLAKKELEFSKQLIELTKNEYKIIECLFLSKNQVMTTENISDYVIGSFDSLSKNTIESHLSSIRRKVKAAGGELPIKNKRGFGYYLERRSCTQ
ncbi:response regulator transcription factor [Aliivibrio sp. S4TY2]|uniref:response regulator transcription factor n=1 Tax=unclassified Aliivibrio TaxID=2645654 RepID=UPI00237827CC|nr:MULTISPECIES: response regulator transcription factor [unclassified Aliivibrio]MDD9158212.1 response regulator transcription factor [Aliivibrio sp. S4TY2]MDD9162127.1 response regulator transcription factor [Aliivibrio sp. S4TY1]MDD9166165.1 response regulator transcription factor [Aliivibrio sp. S4MY2]MDD9170163.1 response regulator transcription factor [Aliivibrio sp. S4MY4]MDD9187192.1 response regulator transcription factor [Aliivibrio sp. S4MY3]